MAPADSTRTRRELARVIFSRLVGMIVILVVVLASALATSYFAPWRYRSRVMMLARAGAGQATLEGRATLRERLSLFVVTQRELVRSDPVLAAALMKFHDESPSGPRGADGVQSYSPKQVEDYISANVGKLAVARRGVRVQTPGGTAAAFSQTYTITVEWPEDRSLAQWPTGTTRSEAANGAQKFARCLVEAYQRYRRELEIEQTRQNARFLKGPAAVVAKEELDEAAVELEAYIASDLKGDLLLVESMLSGISEMGFASLRTTFQAKINSADARLEELRILVREVAAELAKDQKKDGKGVQVFIPADILKANPSMIKLTDAIAQLRMELNKLNPRFTEDYKTLKQTQEELDLNLADLYTALDRQKQQLDLEIATLGAHREKLRDLVKEDEARISVLASKASKYKRLKQTFDNLQGIYNTRREEAAAAAKAAAQALEPLEVMQVGTPSLPASSSPHRPIIWLNVVIGLLAGIVLALTYAFLADHFDHSVKGIGDVETHVGVPVLASIPRIRRRIIRAS